MEFPLENIEHSNKQYIDKYEWNPDTYLGKGAFGIVYKGTNPNDE